MSRLPLSFFNRPTLTVAQELLGKEIVFNEHRAVITETEAYIGEDDPACHAAKGRTKRTEVMYGRAGFSYVYLIYGMYHCLNFVTEEIDYPAAVLIRAVHINGIDDKKLNGPGKLCRFLGITTEHNATDLIHSDSFYVTGTNRVPSFTATPRIGISSGKELLWRFLIA